MKKSIKLLISIFVVTICLALGIFINNKAMANVYDNIEVTTITRSHELLSADYLASYALDTDQTKTKYILKVESNAGVYGQNTREKAVDGYFSTFWETNKVNDDVFKNTFTITLNKEVTIDRLIFATRRDGAETKGFSNGGYFLYF